MLLRNTNLKSESSLRMSSLICLQLLVAHLQVDCDSLLESVLYLPLLCNPRTPSIVLYPEHIFNKHLVTGEGMFPDYPSLPFRQFLWYKPTPHSPFSSEPQPLNSQWGRMFPAAFFCQDTILKLHLHCHPPSPCPTPSPCTKWQGRHLKITTMTQSWEKPA